MRIQESTMDIGNHRLPQDLSKYRITPGVTTVYRSKISGDVKTHEKKTESLDTTNICISTETHRLPSSKKLIIFLPKSKHFVEFLKNIKFATVY